MLLTKKMKVRFRSKDKPIDEDTMSARVFKREKSIVNTKRRIKAKAIIIVLTIIIVLLCVALAFVIINPPHLSR